MKPARGFSLIELIIIIVIASVLTVMALPRFLNTQTINVREAAALVAADIRRTRDLAMADIAPRAIVFDGDHTYTVGAETRTLPGGFTVSTRTITFNALGEPVGATTAISLNVAGVAGAVVVQPYTGTVSNP